MATTYWRIAPKEEIELLRRPPAPFAEDGAGFPPGRLPEPRPAPVSVRSWSRCCNELAALQLWLQDNDKNNAGKRPRFRAVPVLAKPGATLERAYRRSYWHSNGRPCWPRTASNVWMILNAKTALAPRSAGPPSDHSRRSCPLAGMRPWPSLLAVFDLSAPSTTPANDSLRSPISRGNGMVTQ